MLLIIELCGKGSYGAPKEFFYDILGTRKFTEEVLITTFCLVEQSLHNRSLTPVSSDPNDLKALTPNHFLLGHRAISFLPLNFEQNSIIESATHKRNHMQMPSGLAGSVKYVPMLNKRAKCFFFSGIKLEILFGWLSTIFQEAITR